MHPQRKTSLPGRDLHAPPDVLRVFALAGPAVRPQRRHHHIAFLDKDSRQNRLTIVCERIPDYGQHWDEHRRDYVGEYDANGSEQRQYDPRVALDHFDFFAFAVRANILFGVTDRIVVDLERSDAGGPQSRGGNRQYRASRSEVGDNIALPHHALHQAHHAARRRVLTGAERHRRIDDDHSLSLVVRSQPWRSDNELSYLVRGHRRP